MAHYHHKSSAISTIPSPDIPTTWQQRYVDALMVDALLDSRNRLSGSLLLCYDIHDGRKQMK
jgi:hypothetical protein